MQTTATNQNEYVEMDEQFFIRDGFYLGEFIEKDVELKIKIQSDFQTWAHDGN